MTRRNRWALQINGNTRAVPLSHVPPLMTAHRPGIAPLLTATVQKRFKVFVLSTKGVVNGGRTNFILLDPIQITTVHNYACLLTVAFEPCTKTNRHTRPKQISSIHPPSPISQLDDSQLKLDPMIQLRLAPHRLHALEPRLLPSMIKDVHRRILERCRCLWHAICRPYAIVFKDERIAGV